MVKRKVVTILAVVILCITLVFPYENTANAYGMTNHEKVVDAGEMHFVVLREDGTVWSWGDNNYGQLGAKELSNHSTVPVPVRKEDGNRLFNIKSIAAGDYHSVALDHKGDVWTWGRNAWGQLGQGQDGTALPFNNDPKVVPIIDNGVKMQIKAIAAGEHHTLAVDTKGQVWAWGNNTYGQIGVSVNPSKTFVETPSRVNGLSDVIAVAAGANHSVALTSDGQVYAWGRGTDGQIGNGESKDVNVAPEPVENLTGIMEIAAGDNHTLALKQDRTTIYAWGSNSYGQLGDGGFDEKLKPIQVFGISSVKMIGAGNDHTLAIKDDGTVWTWGRNTSGKETPRSTPIQLSGVSNAIAIGGGGGAMNSYSLIASQDGSLYYWDQATSNSTSNLPVAEKVSGVDNVMRIIEYPYVQGGQVVFHYPGNASTVQVIGDFNSWIELPLTKQVGLSGWTKQVELPAGIYSYGYKVDGVLMADPLNRVKKITEFGDVLSELKIPEYPEVGPAIKGNDVTFTYNSYDYTGKLEFDAETTYVAVRGSFNDFVDIPLIKQPNNTWAVTTTVKPGEYYYYFVVRDDESGQQEETRLDRLNSTIQTNPVTGSKRNVFKVSDRLDAKVPVTNIELNVNSTMDLVVGEEYTLQAQVLPAEASNKKIHWTSTEPSVATVDEEGKLTAHSVGKTVIIATTDDGGKMAFVTITVYPQDNAISYPKVGYETFPDKTNVAPNKVWYVQFNKALDINSINNSNVYVLKDNGEKVPVGYQLSNNDQTLEVRLQGGSTYSRGGTYYLFVENTVKTKYTQQNLPKKYQMKFQIAVY